MSADYNTVSPKYEETRVSLKLQVVPVTPIWRELDSYAVHLYNEEFASQGEPRKRAVVLLPLPITDH